MCIRTDTYRRSLQCAGFRQPPHEAGVTQYVVSIEFQGHVAVCGLCRQSLEFLVEIGWKMGIADTHAHRMTHKAKIATAHRFTQQPKITQPQCLPRFPTNVPLALED